MKLGTERRLGATDAAKLLGVSKYGNAADVYARVVLGIEAKPSKPMARGIAYEPVVRVLYRAEKSCEFMRWVTSPVVLQHPTYEWATSSPDDVTTDGRLVDYKTVSRWAAPSWADGPPIDYVLQMLWGMWVGGFESCDLYAAFGDDIGDEFRIDYCKTYEFRRDPELEAEFIEVGAAFWRDHVVPRVPPAMAPLQGKRAFKAATATNTEEAAHGQ